MQRERGCGQSQRQVPRQKRPPSNGCKERATLHRPYLRASTMGASDTDLTFIGTNLVASLRKTLSTCSCNSVAMFFLASSKLLPRTVADRLLQSQPSSSDQKSQSIAMLAVTFRLTIPEVIITPLASWLLEPIIVTTPGARSRKYTKRRLLARSGLLGQKTRSIQVKQLNLIR